MFIYFESTEGGMQQHEIRRASDLARCIYGWDLDQKSEDQKLFKWMRTAQTDMELKTDGSISVGQSISIRSGWKNATDSQKGHPRESSWKHVHALY